ncbi:hypothetical protein OPT61_g1124 [Boeremia exigua]|uniref:Uncharacterized protein n=1 Tax=Boeremia exigua TaxID=749465 RepID=A0ACC2IRC9_9PLEO|nr:hypothetical protein OPT61_g1124 [Boeremia exigua]
MPGSCTMGPREGPKCPLACNYCRLKKAKCDGSRPCRNCTVHKESCVYASTPQRARKRALENQSVLDRVARMESLFDASMADRVVNNAPNIEPGPRRLESSIPTHQALQPQSNQVHIPTLDPDLVQHTGGRQSSPQLSAGLSPSSDLIEEAVDNVDIIPDLLPTPQASHKTVGDGGNSQEAGSTTMASHKPTRTDHPDVFQLSTPSTSVGESVVSPQFSNAEHHGPVSYLSICSNPALEWITQAANAPEYADSARTFAMSTTRNLKLEKKISDVRMVEPDYTTASYFHQSVEAVFALVDEAQFKGKLEQNFFGNANSDEAEWYALRNAVYASGCKVHMVQSSPTNSFESSQNSSWKYFENAMSVHTELIYMRSGLMAIQALMAMAFYTEGLGNPALEYMLISNAVRLAQSKGLHRESSNMWAIPPPDLKYRRWLFWVIYAYDKHIAYRSGRPSAIDDDDICCELPDLRDYEDIANATFVIRVVTHGRLSSRIARNLTSAKSSKTQPDILAQRARKLESELSVWLDSLPTDLRPGVPFRPNTDSGPSLYHALYLHFAYYGSLVAIHSIFAYPWYFSTRWVSEGQIVNQQVSTSTTTLIEASRQIVLAVKYIDVRRPWPAWLVFFYPVVGFINIFIYILKFPNSATITSDLALMDIVAGHFGYLEYYSASQLSFTFVGEMTSIARAAVKKSRVTDKPGVQPKHEPNLGNMLKNVDSFRPDFMGSELRFGAQARGERADTSWQSMMGENFDSMQGGWPSFLPLMSQIPSMTADGFGMDELGFTVQM